MNTVYILKTWASIPVYHDYGRIAEKNGGTADVTKCGLVLYDGKQRYNALLREDHAFSFARPCCKCFEVEG